MSTLVTGDDSRHLSRARDRIHPPHSLRYLKQSKAKTESQLLGGLVQFRGISSRAHKRVFLTYIPRRNTISFTCNGANLNKRQTKPNCLKDAPITLRFTWYNELGLNRTPLEETPRNSLASMAEHLESAARAWEHNERKEVIMCWMRNEECLQKDA